MKSLFYIFTFIFFSNILFSQNCINVDKVYSTAKFRDLNSESTKADIRKIVVDVLSVYGYCISNSGETIEVELYYFGNKRNTEGSVNMDSKETQVSFNLIYRSVKYSGDGIIQNDVREVMLEFMDSKFSETNLAKAIRLAIHSCILQLPKRD